MAVTMSKERQFAERQWQRMMGGADKAAGVAQEAWQKGFPLSNQWLASREKGQMFHSLSSIAKNRHAGSALGAFAKTGLGAGSLVKGAAKGTKMAFHPMTIGIGLAIGAATGEPMYKALGETMGMTVGWEVGWATGAAIGSIIPGFGTAAGALIGGFVGGGIGGETATWVMDKITGEKRRAKSLRPPAWNTRAAHTQRQRSLRQLDRSVGHVTSVLGREAQLFASNQRLTSSYNRGRNVSF